MHDAATVERIRVKYLALSPLMDERVRRHWAATEAMALGWGGISSVAVATGMARNTVAAGVRELALRREQPDTIIDAFKIRDNMAYIDLYTIQATTTNEAGPAGTCTVEDQYKKTVQVGL